MSRVLLLLGSNLGDASAQLHEARTRLQALVIQPVSSSSVYRTKPWGKTDQPDFFNQVIELNYPGTPHELLKHTQEIEHTMGRLRSEKWGPRTIDIDILFFGEQVVNDDDLTIPHPQLQHRRFTMVPLQELAPNLVHPILKKTTTILLDECDDQLEVTRADESKR